jgi:hypothetical protein
MAHCGTGSASYAGTSNSRGEDRAQRGGEFAIASRRAETGHVSLVVELVEAALRQRGLDVREPAVR